MDKLDKMFKMRREFMTALGEKTNFYDFPLEQDLTLPHIQRKIRLLAHNCNEEMFEALGELKGWRVDNYKGSYTLNKQAFIEELVDAQNYLMSILILSGVNEEQFLEVSASKHEKIMNRLTRKNND